jgi:adenylosuccinate lyase
MRYQSPFSNRYGSDEMCILWSEITKRRAWRKVWITVAEVQAAANLVTPEQIDDIKSHALDIDLVRAAEIEAEVGHDLVAELNTFAEQCPHGGAILHWGLTSADVEDNADIVRQKAALAILLKRLRDLLLQFAERIEGTANSPVLGYTHLQPAVPTTLGYRLSSYAQDLLLHFDTLARRRVSLRGKGIKGAVGTAAPFFEMLADSPVTHATLEATVMQALGIEAFPITNQTYPRIQDYQLLSDLAGLAASLHKFAFDLRLMQSPGFRTASEPFSKRQVGSSAMPFKRNPVKAENICSLARMVVSGVQTAWHNAAVNLLERTLDDKGNRRALVPEVFLACDHMLQSAIEIVRDMEVDRPACEHELETYGPFVAVERVLTALVQSGADRQEMHDRLRQHSMTAWETIKEGNPNPLPDQLAGDTTLLHYLQPARIRDLLDARSYLGLAPERASAIASQILKRFSTDENAK